MSAINLLSSPLSACVAVALFAAASPASATPTASVPHVASGQTSRIPPVIRVLSLVQGTNGFNVVEVFHPGGRFFASGGGRWTERGNNGAQFNFIETGRDEWSVYLNDPGRNMQIQIDLHRGLILWSQNNGPKSPLYNITDASGGSNSGGGQIGEAISQEVVQYDCNEGIPMQVVYTNQGNRSTANVIHDGFQLGDLNQIPSGSGVAYSNGRYTLFSKGREAILQWDGITDVCFQR